MTMEDGSVRPFQLEVPTDTGFHLGAGLYFGWQGHHHGEWRGELHVDGERLEDCRDPDVARQLHQLRDTFVVVRDLDTGAEGVGNCQPMITGSLPALGLDGRLVVLVAGPGPVPGSRAAVRFGRRGGKGQAAVLMVVAGAGGGTLDGPAGPALLPGQGHP